MKMRRGPMGDFLVGLVLFASRGDFLPLSLGSLDEGLPAPDVGSAVFDGLGAVDDGLLEPKPGVC